MNAFYHRSEFPRRACVVNYFADGTESNADDPLLKGLPTYKKVIVFETIDHSYNWCIHVEEAWPNPGGGESGGTHIWFGRGCAAHASKLLPISKGHLGRKGYPLLRIFLEK